MREWLTRVVPPFFRMVRRRWLAAAALAVLVAASASCSTMSYYAQAVHGHFALLGAARPIQEWLDDPATPDDLKRRLVLAQKIRAFASRELALPDNGSYTTYANLNRAAAVWNVFAAPELSLELKTWCYPFFGCAGYRGYFDRSDAEREADSLREQGYDVAVTPVPAYSTLGWFNDPILNTFINQGEGELARLIFHELAHQVVYVKNDTAFNESFATAVERAGVQRWFAAEGDTPAKEAYRVLRRRREDFLALLRQTRERLATLYSGGESADVKRARKAEIFANLHREYLRMKAERWDGWGGYDRYFAQKLNNAHLAAIGAYDDLVPAFEALLREEGGDFRGFYARVKALADESRDERRQALAAALRQAN